MSTQKETIILEIQIDNGDLTKKVAENNATVKELKGQMKELKAQAEDALKNGMAASAAEAEEKIAELDNQVRKLNSETKQFKNTIDEGTKANNAAAGSYEQLYRQWKLAETQLKTMEGTIQRNADGTFKLTEKYYEQSAAVKQAKDGLLQFNKGILDGRLNVGNYDNSIAGLEQKLSDLQEAFKHINANSPDFEKTREAIEETKLKIDQLSGKVDEFGEKEPKNPLKKAFDDANEAGRSVIEAFTLLTLLQGENEKASELEAGAMKAVAIATAAVNVVKGFMPTLDTLALVAKKLLVREVEKETAVTSAAAIEHEAAAVAKTEEVIATEAATVAQEELNVAMEANPVGILILGLAALAIALAGVNAYITSSSEETENLEKENKQLSATLTEQNRIISEKIKIAEAELGLAKSQGESAEQIRKKEEAINDAKGKQLTNNVKMIQSAIALDKSKLADVLANDSLLESYLKLWVAIDKWMGLDKEAEKLEKQIAVNKAERAKDAINDLKKQQDALAEAQAALIDTKTDEQNQENDLRNKNLKAQEDHLAQLLVVTQDGTKRKFDLQMQLLNVQQAEEMNAEELTESQKGAIAEKYRNLRAAATRQFALAALKEQEDMLKLEINVMKVGTKEKMDAQMKLLHLQEEEELSVITLSESQKAIIREKYRQLDLQLQRDYDAIFLKDFETSLQLQIKALESKNQQTAEIRKQELDLQLELLDTQEEEELANLELNETERENIREKYRQARIKAEKETNQKIFDDAVKAQQLQLQTEIENLRTAGEDSMQKEMELAAARRDAILNNQASTNEERLKAEADYTAAVQQIQLAHIEFVKKTFEMQKALVGNFMAGINALMEIFGANQTALNEFAKISALFQLSLDAAKAIASVVAAAAATSLDPITLAIKISAGIATVLTDIAAAKKIISGAEQPAAPTIQGFAGGGSVSGKRISHSDGRPSKINPGDDVLITAKAGEVVLNEQQQKALGGDATFAAIGVPGFHTGGLLQTVSYINSNNYGIPGFDAGGLLLSNYTGPINQGEAAGRLESLMQQFIDKPIYVTVEDINAAQTGEAIRLGRADI